MGAGPVHVCVSEPSQGRWGRGMETCESRPAVGLRCLAFIVCLRPRRGAEVEAESAEISGVGMPSDAGTDSEPGNDVDDKAEDGGSSRGNDTA